MSPPIEHADDLLWLRDDGRENEEVLAHLKAENAFTKFKTAHLSPRVDELYLELKSRLKETDDSVPVASGPYEYYSKTFEGRSYAVHARRPRAGDTSREEVVLDENELAEGKEFCDVGSVEPSASHDLVAYSVDFDGDEIYSVHVKSLAVKDEPTDELEETNGSIEWGSARELYYLTMDKQHRPNKLWHHVLGAPQSEDTLLFEENDERFWLGIHKSLSGAFLFLAAESKLTAEVHAIPLVGPARGVPTCVAPRRENVLYEVDHVSDSDAPVNDWSDSAPAPSGVFVILTNADGAKNFKIAVAPVGGGAWTTVVPETNQLFFGSIEAFADGLAITGRAGGLPQIWLCPRASLLERTPHVPVLSRLPAPDAVYSLSVGATDEWTARSLRFHYSSPRTPSCTAEVDFKAALGADSARDVSGADAWRIAVDSPLRDALRVAPSSAIRLLKQKEVPNVDPSQYVTLRTEAMASDGTRVPISILYRPSAFGMAPPRVAQGAPWISSSGAACAAGAACPLPRPARLVLYAYGSYGVSLDKGFSTNSLALADRGIVYAIAHVRGGGEMGRSWYEDGGRCFTKKNTFTDFIAAAEHLIADGWTEKGRLACWGASAGGLLVGAVLNARPDLWGAALSDVGFVDVIESVADPSIPLAVTEWEEWGNPNERAAHDYIKSYSPLDNVVQGARYPPILLTAGLNDSRVAYWEPAKFAQRLRAATSGDPASILLKTDMGAGHFSYSDRYVGMKDDAFQLAWIIETLK